MVNAVTMQVSTVVLITGILIVGFLLWREGHRRKTGGFCCGGDAVGPTEWGNDGQKDFLPVRRQKNYAAMSGNRIDPQLQYMAPLPKSGYSGLGMSVLEHIQQKTHENRYASDFMFRDPYQKYLPADYFTHPQSTAWPLAGSCRPVTEPPLRGLNAAEVIQGENSMRLYATYTVCPGELNDRFMSVQL